MAAGIVLCPEDCREELHQVGKKPTVHVASANTAECHALAKQGIHELDLGGGCCRPQAAMIALVLDTA